MQAEEKVVPINESQPEMKKGEAEQAAKESTGRDMSRVAIVVSLLAVVLLVIFFFGLNRNLAGVSEEVQALRGLRASVDTLNDRVHSLEALPVHMQYAMVAEMETQAVLLARQSTAPEQIERLQKIRSLLLEYKDALVK